MEAPLTRFQEVMYEKTRQSWPTARGLLQLAVCVRFEGVIDAEIFERAASCLAARYPILCSRLQMKEGELLQRQDGGTPSFEVIDVGDDEQQAVNLLSAWADKPFDLFQENPFKIVLGCANPCLAFVMLVAHHVFIDEFALHRLLAEYVDLVINPVRGKVASAGSGDHSFLTWCIQQRTMAGDGSWDRKAQYWLRYLDQADPTIHLPGRPVDPPYQTLASIPFELDPVEAVASLDRTRRLGVTHNSLVVSAIFRILGEVTGQYDITFSLTSSARRPPFDRTIGQFAEVLLVRQRQDSYEEKLDDRVVREVFGDIMRGVKNYIPHSYFSEQIDWLRSRRDRRFTSTDVHVDYLPRQADLDGAAEQSEYRVSHIPLTARTRPSRPAYYGVVMSVFLRPLTSTFAGFIEYESAIVSTQLAQDIATSLHDELARKA